MSVKIVDKIKNEKSFSDIEVGEFFIWEGGLFMKIKMVWGKNNIPCEAIQIAELNKSKYSSSGWSISILSNCKVTPVNLEITLT